MKYSNSRTNSGTVLIQ